MTQPLLPQNIRYISDGLHDYSPGALTSSRAHLVVVALSSTLFHCFISDSANVCD